jgi:hypothetical protein
MTGEYVVVSGQHANGRVEARQLGPRPSVGSTWPVRGILLNISNLQSTPKKKEPEKHYLIRNEENTTRQRLQYQSMKGVVS